MSADALGKIETAILEAECIRAKAASTVNRLHDVRWNVLRELAQPRPGDREAGLLDGLNLLTFQWESQVPKVCHEP